MGSGYMTDLVIVTGGAGFIGSHLVEHLLESDHQIRVIERPGADVAHLPPEVAVVFADIRDRATVERAVRGGRWVYHLAANPNLWVRDRNEFEAVNHQGTINVLELALAAGAERVLHTSTESILTRSDRSTMIDENIQINESDAVGPYCLSKLRAENAAMALARAGQPVVVANPTMPIGAGDRGLSPPTRLIRDFCTGRLPALLDCTLNVVGVRDVALGLVRVMDGWSARPALPAGGRKSHSGGIPGHAFRVDRGSRSAVAGPVSGGPRSGSYQRVLGRSRVRPVSSSQRDRRTTGAQDHALRRFANPGRARPLTEADLRGTGRGRGLAAQDRADPARCTLAWTNRLNKIA